MNPLIRDQWTYVPEEKTDRTIEGKSFRCTFFSLIHITPSCRMYEENPQKDPGGDSVRFFSSSLPTIIPEELLVSLSTTGVLPDLFKTIGVV